MPCRAVPCHEMPRLGFFVTAAGGACVSLRDQPLLPVVMSHGA